MKPTLLSVFAALAVLVGSARAQVAPDLWKKLVSGDMVNVNPGDVLVRADLRLRGDNDSIVFPATAGANSPMIEMFESGTLNADRMVIGHSAAYPAWGLQYRDAGDVFRFLTNGTSVMDVELSSLTVRHHFGTVLNDTEFVDDEDTLTFSTADAINAPMIQMFPSGTSNGNRMVLAHSPAFSDWGLQYRDVGDEFHFLSAGTSVFGVDLGSFELTANADLSFADDNDSITFSTSSGANSAMMYLFPSGTSNADRMVFSHSTAFPNWGLQYVDSSDEFRFLGNGNNAMTIELSSREVGIRTDNPTAALQVGVAGDGSFALANSWNVFSSRDYKKDIVELDANACAAALDKVVATPVFQFHYKDAPEGTDPRIGVIVEESPDEILATEVQVDGKTKAVDLARYVSVLHAALKAQQAEIDRLEAQQTALDEIRAELAELRAAQQR